MGLGVIGSLLVIAGEAAGLVEPTEGALDDPTLAHELEAFGVVAAADDVEVQFAEGAQPFDPLDQGTGVTAIGPDDLQFAKEKVEAGEQRSGSVPVLDGGGSHTGAEDQAQSVHEQMALASA